jgi:hypothetical protein
MTATEASSSSSSSSSLPGPSAARRLSRWLTLWSIVAVALSPFALPTFGAGFLLGAGLIVAAVLLERRGIRARGALAAGIVAVGLSLASAGACGFLFLRTAEVTGSEERRQERVEQRFDQAFDAARSAPGAGSDVGDDADTVPGADSSAAAGPGVGVASPARGSR